MSQEELTKQLEYYNQTFADEEMQLKTADQTVLTDLRESVLQEKSKKREAKRSKLKVAAPSFGAVGTAQDEVNGYYYSMHGHAEKCVETYLELSG